MVGFGFDTGLFAKVGIGVGVDYIFSETVLPRTTQALKKISVPKHEYRSDTDFFLVKVFPGLKPLVWAFYEKRGPALGKSLPKTRKQQQLDRGLSNALKKMLEKEKISSWDEITAGILERVTAFKEFKIVLSIYVK